MTSVAASSVWREFTRALAPIARSYSTVVFGNNAGQGALLFLATASNPRHGLFGLIAVLVANLLARLAGYPHAMIASGRYGYNALLVGLALAQGQPGSIRLLVLVAGGAALAVLLTAVLGDALNKVGLPLLPLPFVIVGSLISHTVLGTDALPAWIGGSSPAVPAALPSHLDLLLQALGAIVYEPSRLGGALVLTAVLIHSRITAVALVSGAAVGLAVVRGLEIVDGAIALSAAYNAALTFAAVAAIFFVPGRASIWVACAASALTAWITAAFMLPFTPVSAPVLAWPFVVVTLALLRALGLRERGRAPVFALLPDATPEANLAYRATFAKRLYVPGPPRFLLPVSGAWRVTQGMNGALTHRGAWSHALDFEVFDREGFPFRGDGVEASQYYCFGAPVLAPGLGRVVAIHDGMPDNPPGGQDLARPFGNAIVIEHGPELYSVLAHLQCGSPRVALGQTVQPGERVASCGSSGRSPRPHLHFQVQASPVLGAPTLSFSMTHYTVRGGVDRFERFGVPREGETVETPALELRLTGEARIFPAAEIELLANRGERTTLRREISLHGEHALVDPARNERLYFVPYAGGVVFTALHAAADGPLGALLQVVPIVPAVSTERVRFSEDLPAGPLLPLPLRLLHEIVRVIAEPASARVESEMTRSRDRIVIESECSVFFFGRRVRRRAGRVELDAKGLRSIELWSRRGDEFRPILSAKRPALSRAFAEADPSPGMEHEHA
jgi:urea transporter/murein DD-endopeptidase MepM/ murein hydrolase activator NlpD